MMTIDFLCYSRVAACSLTTCAKMATPTIEKTVDRLNEAVVAAYGAVIDGRLDNLAFKHKQLFAVFGERSHRGPNVAHHLQRGCSSISQRWIMENVPRESCSNSNTPSYRSVKLWTAFRRISRDVLTESKS